MALQDAWPHLVGNQPHQRRCRRMDLADCRVHQTKQFYLPSRLGSSWSKARDGFLLHISHKIQSEKPAAVDSMDTSKGNCEPSGKTWVQARCHSVRSLYASVYQVIPHFSNVGRLWPKVFVKSFHVLELVPTQAEKLTCHVAHLRCCEHSQHCFFWFLFEKTMYMKWLTCKGVTHLTVCWCLAFWDRKR